MTMAKSYVSEVEERAEFKRKHPNRGIFFKDLKTYPVHANVVRGSAGAHFDLGDNRTMDAHISEIAPGGHNNKHRHRNEAIIYILSGRGYSIMERDGEAPVRLDWQEGDLLSPPLNAWHQHFNADPERPARYLAVTNVPLMQMLGLFTKEKPLPSK